MYLSNHYCFLCFTSMHCWVINFSEPYINVWFTFWAISLSVLVVVARREFFSQWKRWLNSGSVFLTGNSSSSSSSNSSNGALWQGVVFFLFPHMCDVTGARTHALISSKRERERDRERERERGDSETEKGPLTSTSSQSLMHISLLESTMFLKLYFFVNKIFKNVLAIV